MRILLLTIGTRGDVQPFIALGQRLKQNGHDVALCTSSSFSSFVERQGLEYRYLNNDFVELAQGETGRRAMEESGSLAGRIRWMAEATALFKPNFREGPQRGVGSRTGRGGHCLQPTVSRRLPHCRSLGCAGDHG